MNLTQKIEGQITFIKEYKNKNGVSGKTFTLSYMGGTYFSLFLSKGLEEPKLNEFGEFEISLKQTELYDQNGFKKTCFVPVSIIDYSLTVKA